MRRETPPSALPAKQWTCPGSLSCLPACLPATRAVPCLALPCLTLPCLLQDSCPGRVVFVLKEGEKWQNSGGGDFVAHLKPPGASGGWLGGLPAVGCQKLCRVRLCVAVGSVLPGAGGGAVAACPCLLSITARTSALHAPEPVLPCIVLPAEVMSKVLELEGTAAHWSLFNRFVMAAQMLDAADAAGEHTQGVHAAAGMGMGMQGHF